MKVVEHTGRFGYYCSEYFCASFVDARLTIKAVWPAASPNIRATGYGETWVYRDYDNREVGRFSRCHGGFMVMVRHPDEHKSISLTTLRTR